VLNRTFHVLVLTSALLASAAHALAAPTPKLAPAATARAAPAARLVGAEVPRQETASAQIAFAAKLRKSMDGKLGAERDALRAQAVAAYRAVRVLWPEDPDACAEGAFRAGELLRAAKANAEAAQEFEIAREKGSHEGFGSRARLELAHLLRRTKQLERALAEFEALAALPRAPQDRRDEAGLWSGKVQHDLGLRAQACRTWQRVAEQAVDPIDRIQAWDWLVDDLVDARDLEGAAGMLERAREALAPVAAEETKLGERVRNAMQRMRSIDRLQHALEKRARERDGARESM
jgi:tetratricopeptide (TPR) repeat protein